MDIEQISLLAAQGESNTLEYKASTAKLRAAFTTICAFLNSKGGTVLIGVKDKGEIIGQDVTDSTRLEIANEIKKIEPTASIDVQYIKMKTNKFVIAIQVDAGNHVPYVYDGRAFQRNESQTDRMSQHRYEQSLVERKQINYSWEELPATDYTIDNLDHDEIHRAVEQGIAANRVPTTVRSDSIKDILKNWKLIRDDGNINNAAVILFAKKVFPRYSQCHLKMGLLRGTDMLSDFIDNRKFFGNAFQMFSEASNFILKHLPIASFFEDNQLERIDKPALPALAVREALINAICHCDYSNRAASITATIFTDRMEIWNYGKLTSELKFEDLKKQHKSIPRNIIIAGVFYDRKFFDGWGKGTIEMFDICQKNDVPEPEFKEYSGGVAVTFKFRESMRIEKNQRKKTTSDELITRQRIILNFIKDEKEATTQQILNHINLNLHETLTRKTIVRDLNHLKSKNLVELKGQKRGAIWSLNSHKL